ncbi:MAG: hypothetical protein Q9220_004314 [cf. Caloplaca sp. 1 TL-2023]
MFFSSELIALAATTLFTSSIASPLNPRATAVNCNDPKTGVAPNCWNTLKVSDYMTNWQKANFPTHCKEGESWSVCFDRLATSNLKQDCTVLNSSNCASFDPKFQYLAPQWFYGAHNTYTINRYLTSWSAALKHIQATAPSIITSAAQPNDFDAFRAAHNTNAQGANSVNIDIALANLIHLSGSTPQSDALAALLPTFKSFTTYDANNIVKADPPVADLLQIRLQQLLKHVESDVPSFVQMAGKGAFSVPEVISSATLVKALNPKDADVASIE